MSGYTATELEDVQAKWNLHFPPDLAALYRERRRVIDDPRFGSLDWLKADEAAIRDALGWPLKGFLFDISNGLWWPEWGEMPADICEREAQFSERFIMAPKLIPVCGHRYIPEVPNEAGNPVFSVWQMDVVVYGADLADYIARENSAPRMKEPHPVRTIPFWSRAVEFNMERFAGGGGFAFLNRGGILPENDER